MQQALELINDLYQKWKGRDAASVEILPKSGSERRYFRVHEQEGGSVIATLGANVQENETFIYFSQHFRKIGLPVPEILVTNDDGTIYLQQDFGNISLLNHLEREGFSEHVYGLFKKSLHELARLQVKAHEDMDYEYCLTNKEFGKEAIMADLLYFKYYFLDALRRPYDKQKLLNDFEALSNYLAHTEFKYFMFRDFQSRNIMVTQGDEVFFIDYQGGMQGAPQYDVASMLWQARANLPDDWKEKLLNDYMESFSSQINQPLDKTMFRIQYNGYVLIRLLQVLGAYGFRGLFERKAQFLTSIPLALMNLKWFIENQSLGIIVPEFMRVLQLCVSDEVIEQFTPLQASEDTPLVVKIQSFSYKKGCPADESGNGGGFVFDCRGILNPGRIDEYKTQHGRNKPVMDFLEQQSRMSDFLNSVFDIVDLSVEEYIRRGFANLMVSFGCTGGQHRSVYAADALARHLKNKFKVKIELMHVVQEEKNWENPLPLKNTTN